MTTQLEAVQRVASLMGFARPIALETGQETDAGRIEAILNESSADVQKHGWGCNRVVDRTIALPTRRIPFSGSSGTPIFGETFTESVSLATATFNRTESGSVHLAPLTGTLTGNQTLTGGTSAATLTGSGAAVTLTSNKIGIPSTWINVFSASGDPISQRGLFLYDAFNSTLLFTGPVNLHATELLAMADLPGYLAEAIIFRAAVEANINFKRATVDHQIFTDRAQTALATALSMDQNEVPINIFNSPDAQRIVGVRRPGRGIRYGE